MPSQDHHVPGVDPPRLPCPLVRLKVVNWHLHHLAPLQRQQALQYALAVKGICATGKAGLALGRTVGRHLQSLMNASAEMGGQRWGPKR